MLKIWRVVLSSAGFWFRVQASGFRVLSPYIGPEAFPHHRGLCTIPVLTGLRFRVTYRFIFKYRGLDSYLYYFGRPLL